jgi:predicted PurR-regulated permease PerM/phosphoglycolate phosphatase-like HAD superfamily hydrolase
MTASPQWGRSTKLLVVVSILVLAGLLVYSFRAILPLVIIAFLIAYIFAPVVGWISRLLHIGRGWATLLLYLIGLAALATVPAIIVPSILGEVQSLIANLGSIINRGIVWLDGLDTIEAFGYTFAAPEFSVPEIPSDMDGLMGLLEGTISPIAGGAFSVVRTVALGVGQVSVLIVMSAYLLVDTERVSSVWRRIVPEPYVGEATELVARISATWNAFLRGQLVLSLVVGGMVTVATTALGLRYSVALGIIAGLLEIIPNLGPTLAAVPAVLLALFQGSTYLSMSNLWLAVVVAITYAAIQSIENNLLVPRIMGSTLDLHPVVVIMGVLAGVTLGGILGALLASPVLATLRHVLRYAYYKLMDLDPFPPPPSFAARVRERRVRAILFDLDGTLLDTDDMLVEEITGRLSPLAFLDRLYARRKLARRVIMGLEGPLNLMITVMDLLRLDKMVFSWGSWLRAAYGRQQPARYVAIDGVLQLVKAASERYDLAITTTRGRQEAEAFVQRFGLEGYLTTIVTRQDVRRLKPHPEPIQRAAESLGHLPEQCVVVGDTTVDVLAAKRAGALAVAVLCGLGERSELERLGPDLVLETTACLADHLPDMGGQLQQAGIVLSA